MREYATQMEAARKGIITEELKKVAVKERMSEEELLALTAEGRVVICANKNHKCIEPEGIGSMLKTKINVNLGVSRDCKDYDIEMQKVMEAVNMGAHAIMDLSSHGDTIPFRRKLTSECPALIGTVPVYDSVIHYQRDLDTLTAQDFIDVVRLHAQDGVDFVTLHCGITRKTIDQIRTHKRKMNIVSRGGSLVFAWMCMTGNENPFYEYYDEILDICREYDVTVSLGDACRPGCIADASDVCQIEELVRLGELTKRAWAKDVQVLVEGPGHMPIDQIAANMKIQQTICGGAPFYVLGPLVTDIAPGYDHITSAIGGAVAAAAGAAFLCYVTPAEHLALPNVEDVKQGIIASKIAAHAADLAKGIRGAREMDDRMADARRALDWEAQWACAIDPETAKKIREDRKPEHDDTCSMCGKFCAVRSMNKALAGEHIDILDIEINTTGINVGLIENDAQNCCLTEEACGRCQHEQCIIGYAKQCIADYKSNPKKGLENGMERIPTADFKVFEEEELENGIMHLLKECKNCKGDHTENCIINVLRSCYEVGLFGDVQTYEGTALQYLMRLKTAFPEKAERISELYIV